MSAVVTPCNDTLEFGSTVKVVTTLQPKDIYCPHKCKHCSRREKCWDNKGVFFGVVLAQTAISLQCNADDSSHILVLSLSRQSPPFSAGQIIWIKEEQIRSITVIDS